MKALVFLLVMVLTLAGIASRALGEESLRMEPAAPVLMGAESRQQLLVSAMKEGREWDVTEDASYQSSDPKIATVSTDGVVLPVADGVVKITAVFKNWSVSTDVKVINAKQLSPIHFGHDIIPLLTKAGCNSGSCHGKQSGQNGFKLSVFGHDVATDYQALSQEGRGRRLFPAAPTKSLILTKATNRVPHGGGRRLEEDSTEYRRLLRWIEEGMPPGDDQDAAVTSIEVCPSQRIMNEHSKQRLLVTAHLSDGTVRDVTHEALFRSNDETLALVDPQGRITTTMLSGESAIVVRYQEHVATSHITVPLNRDGNTSAELAKWNRDHFIDRLVAEKWERLNLLPSPAADDATFLRRVSLDLIGKLPTPTEARTFLADTSLEKRTQLIDALLNRPEYADFWALRWADLLRINREELGARPSYDYHQWLRESLRKNQPYDEFLRAILTAQGSSQRNGAVNFYKAFANPNDLAVGVGQVFLGLRLECAKCHHHPYEKWGQDDFYGLAAFFPRVQKKPVSGAVYIADKGEVKHPRTKATVLPHVLLGEPVTTPPEVDPRQPLANWLASPENKRVARALVNRIWGQLMGRGLVEPLDDMRETNPSINEPLLSSLADDFVAHRFDVRNLVRTIVTSRVYALRSESNATNIRDLQNYSRAYRKRLSAEVLLDAVCDVTGEAETFAGMPPGTRAVQLWDQRLPSAFLDTFGRPQRKSICQCERLSETTLGQVLHLLNSPIINDKITSPTGRSAQLAASSLSADDIITELYLAALGRPPSENERTAAQAAYAASGATRRGATEDILWALLNSAEFVLNH